MSILVMNLMVGLAVDDISAVRRQSVAKTISMHTDFCLTVEFSKFMSFLNFRQRYSANFVIRSVKIKKQSRLGLIKRILKGIKSILTCENMFGVPLDSDIFGDYKTELKSK